MNGHPSHELLAQAAGTRPAPDVLTHLEGCRRCREVAGALVDVDLESVWAGVSATIDAPAPTLIERLASRAGIDPGLARFAALTPTIGPAWLLASVAMVGLGLGLGWAAGATAGTPALVVAPLVAAAVVAFAYGPAVDPAYEVVAVTPLSPARGLLARLALVLTVNAVVVAAVDLAIPGGAHATWLLPMAAVALLAALVAARTLPMVGAVSGAGTWLLVLGAVRGGRVPLAALGAGPAQLGFAVAGALLLVLLVRSARGGWSGRLPTDPTG